MSLVFAGLYLPECVLCNYVYYATNTVCVGYVIWYVKDYTVPWYTEGTIFYARLRIQYLYTIYILYTPASICICCIYTQIHQIHTDTHRYRDTEAPYTPLTHLPTHTLLPLNTQHSIAHSIPYYTSHTYRVSCIVYIVTQNTLWQIQACKNE